MMLLRQWWALVIAALASSAIAVAAQAVEDDAEMVDDRSLWSGCEQDIQFYIKTTPGNCPNPSGVTVGNQSGGFNKFGWPGTGSYSKFSTFSAINKVKFDKKGHQTIKVCFKAGTNLALKSIQIGDTYISATSYSGYVGDKPAKLGGGIGSIKSGESLSYNINVTKTGWFPVKYAISRQCGAPDPSPTPAPKKPTPKPTHKPTAKPTHKPTPKPTKKPTPPSKCPDGKPKCGYKYACCLPSETCFPDQYDFSKGHRDLVDEINAAAVAEPFDYEAQKHQHRELTYGFCCPKARTCKKFCCAPDQKCSTNGKYCVPGGEPDPTDAPTGVARRLDEPEVLHRWQGARIVV